MAHYTTREAVLKLGEIDPEFAKYLETNVPYEPLWSDLPVWRAQMKAMMAAMETEPHGGSTRSFPTRDGQQNEFLLFRPSSVPAGGSPLIVLIYGGGFVIGSPENVAPLAKMLSEAYGATVVCPQYRLAPEHKFPTAPNDIWDFLTWLTADKKFSSLGADPSAGFVVGGISSGANIAAVIVQKSVDQGLLPPLSGAWLSIPVVLSSETVPDQYQSVYLSREQNSEAAFLNDHAIGWIEKYYEMDFRSPDFSPFNSSTPHKGMPRTYLQVAGQDPLRDDGLIYERALRAAGVETKMDVYAGVPHGFNHAIPQLKVSEQANMDTISGFEWLLRGPSSTK